jgi:hypothetical protein
MWCVVAEAARSHSAGSTAAWPTRYRRLVAFTSSSNQSDLFVGPGSLGDEVAGDLPKLRVRALRKRDEPPERLVGADLLVPQNALGLLDDGVRPHRLCHLLRQLGGRAVGIHAQDRSCELLGERRRRSYLRVARPASSRGSARVGRAPPNTVPRRTHTEHRQSDYSLIRRRQSGHIIAVPRAHSRRVKAERLDSRFQDQVEQPVQPHLSRIRSVPTLPRFGHDRPVCSLTLANVVQRPAATRTESMIRAKSEVLGSSTPARRLGWTLPEL